MARSPDAGTVFVDDLPIDRYGEFDLARIRALDVSKARRRPGVIAVFAAEDLGDYWQPGPLLVPPPPIPHPVKPC